MLPLAVSEGDAAALLRSWGRTKPLRFEDGDPLAASWGGKKRKRAAETDGAREARPVRTESQVRKLMVMDTCFILELLPSDRERFASMTVVIPWAVTCELDSISKTRDEGRKIARQKALDARNWLLHESEKASEGHESNVTFQRRSEVDETWAKTATCTDDHILGCAIYLHKAEASDVVVFCTNDKNLKLKAQVEGLHVMSM